VEAGRKWRRGDHTRLVEAICGGTLEQALDATRFHLTENWRTTRERLSKFLGMEEEQ
jgi:hypothetical protein